MWLSLFIYSLLFSVRLVRIGLKKMKLDPNNQLASQLESKYQEALIAFYWGMELYRRIGKSFDIKVFMNCRFGMMSWAVLAITYCIKQVSLCCIYKGLEWMTYVIHPIRNQMKISRTLTNQINHSTPVGSGETKLIDE
ncbi:hypothetical protein V6N13_023462 [Hibiscus sabdariffa]